MSLLWQIAEFITLCVRRKYMGIHPGAHVGVHLILWLACVVLIGIGGTVVYYDISDYDYRDNYYYSSYYDDEDPAGIRNFFRMEQAELAFAVLILYAQTLSSLLLGGVCSHLPGSVTSYCSFWHASKPIGGTRLHEACRAQSTLLGLPLPDTQASTMRPLRRKECLSRIRTRRCNSTLNSLNSSRSPSQLESTASQTRRHMATTHRQALPCRPRLHQDSNHSQLGEAQQDIQARL